MYGFWCSAIFWDLILLLYKSHQWLQNDQNLLQTTLKSDYLANLSASYSGKIEKEQFIET